MRDIIYTFLTSVLIFRAFVSSAPSNEKEVCNSAECQFAAKSIKESMDTSANPCDNFYQYACGNWPKVHPIPAGKSQMAPAFMREDENNKELLGFLKKSNDDKEPQAVHKARQLFALCMTEEADYNREIGFIKLGLSQIGLPEIPSIEETKNSTYDYINASVKAFRELKINMFFNIGVEPNPYNQSVNVIRLTKPKLDGIPLYPSKEMEEESDEIKSIKILQEGRVKMCKNSTELICKVFATPNDTFDQNTWNTFREYRHERRQIILQERKSNYSFYSLQELQNITDSIIQQLNTTLQLPKFDWKVYINLIFANIKSNSFSLNDTENVQIAIDEISFVDDMIKFIYTKTLKQHEFALWWNVVRNLLHYSDSQFLKNEESCLNLVSDDLGFALALSYYYTTKEQYRNLKHEIQEMVRHILDILSEQIKQAEWAKGSTKKRALSKLKALKSYAVYPSVLSTTNMLDEIYGGVEIPDNMGDAIKLLIRRSVRRELLKNDKINEYYEDSWIMTPNVVNAGYSPALNTIIIPAGILGSTMHMHGLKVLDYAQIGVISGHEITHGFDNVGSQYNENGQKENWWDPETLDSFNNKTKCFLDAYENYDINFNGITQKVDSKSSLPDNIADNGGFKVALYAYRKNVKDEEQVLPEFGNFTHEQIFTLAYANLWCENLKRPISKYSAHSPGGVRVNGVLMNSEEFPKIWKCPEGSNMNPKNKCSVW